jgi:hypothetical protein
MHLLLLTILPSNRVWYLGWEAADLGVDHLHQDKGAIA